MESMSLESARNMSGLTIEEAADHCGIPVDQMKKHEEFPGDMHAGMVMKIRELYGIPIDYIKI